MTDTTAQLIPDSDQHDLLMATLERVNKACNAARVRALDESVKSGPALRSIVLEELERFRLPATFNVPSTLRVTQSLTRQKFGNYQSITFSAAALKWSGTDRVSIPTSAGRRTIRVYVDSAHGSLKHPLEGKSASLVLRSDEFVLVDATITDED